MMGLGRIKPEIMRGQLQGLLGKETAQFSRFLSFGHRISSAVNFPKKRAPFAKTLSPPFEKGNQGGF
jgi:hypothetical protein